MFLKLSVSARVVFTSIFILTAFMFTAWAQEEPEAEAILVLDASGSIWRHYRITVGGSGHSGALDFELAAGETKNIQIKTQQQ